MNRELVYYTLLNEKHQVNTKCLPLKRVVWEKPAPGTGTPGTVVPSPSTSKLQVSSKEKHVLESACIPNC